MESFPILRKIVSFTGTNLALMECMYSMIMAFIIITSVRFGLVELESKKDYIVLMFGVLFTWGFLDAILFSWVDILDQKERVRTFDEIRNLPEDEAVERLLTTMNGTNFALLGEDEKRRLCREAYRGGLKVDEGQLRKNRKMVIQSALGCWAICVITLIPLIVPVLFFDGRRACMIASSFVASAVLFVIGYKLAGNLGKNRWLFAIALTSLTWIISLISMVMGG